MLLIGFIKNKKTSFLRIVWLCAFNTDEKPGFSKLVGNSEKSQLIAPAAETGAARDSEICYHESDSLFNHGLK